ncbi:MAG: hypothetical protein JSV09_12840 [Thermoplasmata archaeon]|nr:MAG: hypothetical protein JSV09_12840 [Thermoplasmata archaeon]
MLLAVIVFSALSAGILLSGLLINRIEDPFSPLNFAKGIQMNFVGALPPIIGLAYVIIKFNEIGLFTGG